MDTFKYKTVYDGPAYIYIRIPVTPNRWAGDLTLNVSTNETLLGDGINGFGTIGDGVGASIALGPVKIDQLMGFFTPGRLGGIDIETRVHKPEPYSWSPSGDDALYGRVYSSSVQRKGYYYPRRTENPVTHLKYVGTLSDSPTLSHLYQKGLPPTYVTYPPTGTVAYEFSERPSRSQQHLQLTGLSPLGCYTYGLHDEFNPLASREVDYCEFLDGIINLLANHGPYYRNQGAYEWLYEMGEDPLRYTLTPTSFSLKGSYLLQTTIYDGTYGSSHILYKFRYDISLSLSSREFVAPSINDVYTMPSGTWDYHNASDVDVLDYSGPYWFWLPPYFDSEGFVRTYKFDLFGGYPFGTPSYFAPEVDSEILQSADITGTVALYSFGFAGSSSVSRRAAMLRRAVETNMPEIRKSTYLACTDGLDNWKSIFSTNWLQDMQHLQDILRLLPDVSKISQFAAHAVNGDLSSIPELVDLLTEEILKQRFERAPLTRDLDALLSVDVVKRLGDIGKDSSPTLHGSFSYDFSDSENFMRDGRLKLITRSKVQISLNLQSLLAQYLIGDGLGLVPTLSRLWDLVPFSFVVNWFTNMGQRIHNAESQLVWACLGVDWCLHSYSVYWYPSDALLRSYDLKSTDPSDQFAVKYYGREFSLYAPALRDSKFDFLRAKGPNALTAGALIWQLL
jgi:hypothetical protein